MVANDVLLEVLIEGVDGVWGIFFMGSQLSKTLVRMRTFDSDFTIRFSFLPTGHGSLISLSCEGW